jgi:hypothetical protein
MTGSVQYSFRQPFRVSAERAYRWCTDFGPADGALFSQPTKRTVRRLSEDTLVLIDVTRPAGRLRRIRRLVRLDPTRRRWTNTHLDGPFRYSQYWYAIVADGANRSHLEFQGLRVEPLSRSLSREAAEKLAARLRQADAGEWRRRLAPALERDLAAPERAKPVPRVKSRTRIRSR